MSSRIRGRCQSRSSSVVQKERETKAKVSQSKELTLEEVLSQDEEDELEIGTSNTDGNRNPSTPTVRTPCVFHDHEFKFSRRCRIYVAQRSRTCNHRTEKWTQSQAQPSSTENYSRSQNWWEIWINWSSLNRPIVINLFWRRRSWNELWRSHFPHNKSNQTAAAWNIVDETGWSQTKDWSRSRMLQGIQGTM